MKWMWVVLLLLPAGCLYEDRYGPPPPVTKTEIIELTKRGTPDEDIIASLRRNGMDRRLTADDLVELKKAGVSEKILLAAVDAPVRAYDPYPIYSARRTPWYYDDDWTDLAVDSVFLGWTLHHAFCHSRRRN